MPFPNDEELMKTAADLVAQLQAIFGPHPGFRPAHAKGVLLTGTFTPSTTAASLSKAPHFSLPSTPVLIRFSNSTGLPNIPDTDENADPRGIAVRFQLPEVDGRRRHTDIIAHSTPTFPTRTGAEFLQFLKALAAGGDAVGKFLGEHPKALVHVQWPKPAPESFGTEKYWSVNAFKLVSAEGKETFVRYQIVPTASISTLSAEELKAKDAEYLSTEIRERVANGPVGFKILAQLAVEGDATDDATEHWAESNPVVELGSLELTAAKSEEENLKEQKTVIFDPVPRVDGVEPSADPLLEVRAALYLISGKQRRAA
ncbi:catalase-like domain-containing protein [Bisporella sp. PMI_857]|nr:catalase-like domain-containing protein [Bisporella sp. PMI_857]